VRAELRKVTWPSWKGTMASTAVVVVVVIIVAIFLGIVDLGLTNVIKLILG
jgi:preprotein translocase subunit SecE